MLNLTENDKILINKNKDSGKIVTLSMGDYFIKYRNKAYALKELIGARIATEVFGLKCPQYYAIRLNDNFLYYVLSTDLNREGKFLTLDKLDFKELQNSLYDAWRILEEKYGKSFNEMLDIIKVYIFDVIFHNLDRRAENIGILFLPDGSRKVVMLDNELMLNNDKNAEFKMYPETHLSLYANLGKPLNIYQDFMRFLTESSSEFILLFKYYFELITPEYFTNLITELAIENNFDIEPIPDITPSIIETLSELYRVHYSHLKMILEKFERGEKIAR